jgi:hypothetical protein
MVNIICRHAQIPGAKAAWYIQFSSYFFIARAWPIKDNIENLFFILLFVHRIVIPLPISQQQ